MSQLAGRLTCLSAAVLLAASGLQADVTVAGAITNCDVTNTTPEVCDEMEIELRGPHAADVTGTWGNYNYGYGTVHDLPDMSGILVNYRRAGHTTALHAIEHFGIHMNSFSMLTGRTFRWKHNGLVVLAGPGASVQIPIPQTFIPPAPIPVVVEVIQNEQPEQVMWIRRSIHQVPGVVTLDQLLATDPLITGATPLETELFRLDPGDVLETVENLDVQDFVFTQVIVIENYSDIATFNSGTGDWTHVAGERTSRNMSATVVQRTPCAIRPTITVQPVSAAARLDGAAEFHITATSPPESGALRHQWFKDGVSLLGEDTARLRVDPMTPALAGIYSCRVSNDCGMVTSDGVTLKVSVNCSQADVAGGNPGGDGIIDGTDFIAFINSFVVGDPAIDPTADVAGGGPNNDLPDDTIDGGDFIAFINAFGAGC